MQTHIKYIYVQRIHVHTVGLDPDGMFDTLVLLLLLCSVDVSALDCATEDRGGAVTLGDSSFMYVCMYACMCVEVM